MCYSSSTFDNRGAEDEDRKDNHLANGVFWLHIAAQKAAILRMILSLMFWHRNLISMFSPTKTFGFVGENHCPNEVVHIILFIIKDFLFVQTNKIEHFNCLE
ncbi:hypothetical protein CJ483_22915 [Bacillus sp. PK3_68]|nr:hypothetical protein CJ483_22915 [Bacillus sp. PK3_68]